VIPAAWRPDEPAQGPVPAEHRIPSHAAGGEAVPKPVLRLDIQGLRALAVSLVVLSHAGIRHFRGGYIGVDVFFVISGFLITSLLLRELAATGSVSVRKFYSRRALRLLPVSTVVVVATLGGAWLYLSKVRFAEYAHDALSSTFYVVNFRLAISGTDYLNEGVPPSPFQHFWSLAVEEQFYLLWPLLLLLSWRMARRRRGLLAVPLVVLCLVSFALNVSMTDRSASWAYFGSHTRIWELGVGSLLALFAGRLARMSARLSAPITWIGLAGIVWAALRFDNDTPFPGYYALVPVLGASLVLAGGCSPARLGAGLVLSRRPVTWLGGLSYGWYLWHWPLLVIVPMALDRPATARLGLAICVVALALAWLTLHLVENPVRFHATFRGRPTRALGLGFSLSAGAAVIALVAAAFPPAISTSAPAPALESALASAPDPLSRLTQLLDKSSTSLPSNLTPALASIKGTESAIYRDGCHVNYQSTNTPACVYGDPSSDKVVVLFGDSHAAQWFPAVDRLAREEHWKLVSLTKASCKVAAVTTVYHGKPYSSCDEWRSKALARIVELHPALVIASSSDAGDPAHPSSDPHQQWTDGFGTTFRTLRNGGARVAEILDTPWPKGDAVDCAALYSRELERCDSDRGKAIQDPTRSAAIREAAKSAGVFVIDPVSWLCAPAGNCPVVVGDTFVYRDDSHLDDSYSEAIAPVLGNELTARFGKDLNK
jgi:peptidoglycan/LPS O-acetylase OafA/YrhL